MDVLFNRKETERKIEDIQDDFSCIKYELESISNAMYNDFKGIGTVNCGDYLNKVKNIIEVSSNEFNAIYGTLDNIMKGIDSFVPEENKENN